MLYSAIHYDKLVALRYPRGRGPGHALVSDYELIPYGKAEVLRQGTDATIVAIGAMVEPSLAAADRLAEQDISAGVINARFAKPLDTETIFAFADKPLITVEENVLAGGFGSAVLEAQTTPASPRRSCASACRTTSSPTATPADCATTTASRQKRIAARIAAFLREGLRPWRKKERLDVLVVQQGLADTREKAQKYIMAGMVLVNDQKMDKAGTKVPTDAVLRLVGEPLPYASRGGFKLAEAFKRFPISMQDAVVVDLGASTGGFVDCALQNGAKRVIRRRCRAMVSSPGSCAPIRASSIWKRPTPVSSRQRIFLSSWTG